MTRLLLTITLILALGFGVLTSPLRATAKEHMDLMEMAMQAKTPADHEKLAAQYDQEATDGGAKATMHKKMAEDIRKMGGSLFAKVHYDEHCDGLAASFTKLAEQYAALATAERDMAKM